MGSVLFPCREFDGCWVHFRPRFVQPRGDGLARCLPRQETNHPSREEAAPRAFSSGAASDLSGSLEESVAMDALEWPRRAASELLGLRAGRSLRHHFREVTIILDYAAAQEGRTVARPA